MGCEVPFSYSGKIVPHRFFECLHVFKAFVLEHIYTRGQEPEESGTTHTHTNTNADIHRKIDTSMTRSSARTSARKPRPTPTPRPLKERISINKTTPCQSPFLWTVAVRGDEARGQAFEVPEDGDAALVRRVLPVTVVVPKGDHDLGGEGADAAVLRVRPRRGAVPTRVQMWFYGQAP